MGGLHLSANFVESSPGGKTSSPWLVYLAVSFISGVGMINSSVQILAQ